MNLFINLLIGLISLFLFYLEEKFIISKNPIQLNKYPMYEYTVQ